MIDYKAIMADMERRAEEALEWMLRAQGNTPKSPTTGECVRKGRYHNASARVGGECSSGSGAHAQPRGALGDGPGTTDEHGNPWGSALAFARHKLTNYDALLHMSGGVPVRSGRYARSEEHPPHARQQRHYRTSTRARRTLDA
jgi:hypothetical protein